MRHIVQSAAGNSARFSQHCLLSSELTAASRQDPYTDTALHWLSLSTPILLRTICLLANLSPQLVSHVCQLSQAQCLRNSQVAACSPYCAAALHKHVAPLQNCCSLLLVAQQMLMHLQIQNHATTALSNLGQRCLYGELWQPTVQTIADAFISLQKSENDDDRSINAGMFGPPSSL